jgi:hypothetical protein
MKVTWDKVNPGDFFFIELESYGQLLYQKIIEKEKPYNAVLLNTGDLCCIHQSVEVHKVTVTFNIHND